MTYAIGIFVFNTVVFCGLMWLFYRNNRVAAFRRELLLQVSDAATDDIAKGREWHWRYEEYEKVTYNQMVLSFKPLTVESFYQSRMFSVRGSALGPVVVKLPVQQL